MELSEKISRIRAGLLNNTYPMAYNDDSLAKNCYAYAIGSEYREDTNDDYYVFNLGTMSQKGFPKTIKSAKYIFMADMEALGIECKESYYNDPIQSDEWKVMLLYRDPEKGPDFHVVRQDIDGAWSQKRGCTLFGEIQRIKAKNVDELVKKCEYEDYDLVGFFKLKLKP